MIVMNGRECLLEEINITNKKILNNSILILFKKHLIVEKNASKHTINSYLIDINQFCKTKWNNQKPPFSWKSANFFQLQMNFDILMNFLECTR